MSITTGQKRELVRFVIYFTIPVPFVFWWGQIRPDEPSPALLVLVALIGGTVFFVARWIADWVVRRVPWSVVTPDAPAPTEPPPATHPDPRSE